MKRDYKKLLKLSDNILKQSSYAYFKELIRAHFKGDNNKENIMNRLIIIDSLYSTNLSKRLYGFDDLAEFIISIESEYHIDGLTIDYFINELIDKISNRKIGIKINGEEGGIAFSLITKYLYFRNNFDFPIYDSLVKDELALIKGEIKSKKDYFICLEGLKNENNLSFDELDKILWLSGKLKKLSFSGLLNSKNEYKLFIKNLGLKKDEVITVERILQKSSENQFIINVQDFFKLINQYD